MHTLSLLEMLAQNAHHRYTREEILKSLPQPAQQAFLSNNSTQLKHLLGGSNNLADRDMVVTIHI
jgi:hypothetical protein